MALITVGFTKGTLASLTDVSNNTDKLFLIKLVLFSGIYLAVCKLLEKTNVLGQRKYPIPS